MWASSCDANFAAGRFEREKEGEGGGAVSPCYCFFYFLPYEHFVLVEFENLAMMHAHSTSFAVLLS